MPSTLSDRLAGEFLGTFLGGTVIHVFRHVSAEVMPDFLVPLCGRYGIAFVRPPQKVTQDGYLCQRCRRRLEKGEEDTTDAA